MRRGWRRISSEHNLSISQVIDVAPEYDIPTLISLIIWSHQNFVTNWISLGTNPLVLTFQVKSQARIYFPSISNYYWGLPLKRNSMGTHVYPDHVWGGRGCLVIQGLRNPYSVTITSRYVWAILLVGGHFEPKT